jgi:molecular chaperone GrpE
MSDADPRDVRAAGPVPEEEPPASGDPSPPGHPQPSAAGETDGDAGVSVENLTVESLVEDLERVARERDEYLALAQSKQAEFENFRKRMMKQQADDVARSSAKLVEGLLPVLDAFDYGIAHGDDSLVPMRAQLVAALEREGLVRLDPESAPFDPTEHEAVAHEPGDGGEPVVAETLRAGYRWQGHLLRPAMVKVKD